MSDPLPDLSAHIDQAIEAGLLDVADIAVRVRSTVPAEVLEAHMMHFLRLAVRDRMSQRRSRNPVLRGAPALTRPTPGRPAVAGGSNKRARQRNQFAADRARWLADQVWIGDRRVILGAATFDDLVAAASSMREQSSRSLATADRYEEIAKAVKNAGVSTVGELPDAEMRKLIERE